MVCLHSRWENNLTKTNLTTGSGMQTNFRKKDILEPRWADSVKCSSFPTTEKILIFWTDVWKLQTFDKLLWNQLLQKKVFMCDKVRIFFILTVLQFKFFLSQNGFLKTRWPHSAIYTPKS